MCSVLWRDSGLEASIDLTLKVVSDRLDRLMLSIQMAEEAEDSSLLNTCERGYRFQEA